MLFKSTPDSQWSIIAVLSLTTEQKQKPFHMHYEMSAGYVKHPELVSSIESSRQKMIKANSLRLRAIFKRLNLTEKMGRCRTSSRCLQHMCWLEKRGSITYRS